MDLKIIFVYCLWDDILKLLNIKDDKQSLVFSHLHHRSVHPSAYALSTGYTN